MKTLSAALQAHLDGGTTTLAWCWRIETKKNSQSKCDTQNPLKHFVLACCSAPTSVNVHVRRL